jgi:hypothetical protein
MLSLVILELGQLCIPARIAPACFTTLCLLSSAADSSQAKPIASSFVARAVVMLGPTAVQLFLALPLRVDPPGERRMDEHIEDNM